MDTRQQDILTSNAIALAEEINFIEMAEYLKLAKLVTEERIQDIVSKVESSFGRNLKLLNALQESRSTSAFDEFIKILQVSQNHKALDIMKHHLSSDDSEKPPIDTRSIWSRMADKFSPKSLGQSGKYPLGLASSRTSSNSGYYGSGSTSAQSDSPLSPLKEKPRATLIRPQELALIDNLSISDQDQGDRSTNTSADPVLCWHPYARSQAGSPSSYRGQSPHVCNPSIGSASSESDDESLMIDPNLILDSNVTLAIAREGANMMSVKHATVCHDNLEEDYKMTSRPRGPCLIINNIDFEAEIFPTRKGSDEDARRFDDIFQQLGFSVIMRRNQTADQMRQLFKDVANECKPEHDALFVFILSHGSEHGIYGTDGMEVYLENEIISCFDNRNCKALLGKPKVFVIQACRGRAKDCGGIGDTTDSIAWSPVSSSSVVKSATQENRVPATWLPNLAPDGKKRKHPIRTDILLVFSCLAGFVSVRNELAGSWLGVALAYFIMTHAHERDLLRILNLVTSDVIQRESSNGHIQSIELKLLGWTKNLYFNPGIYI